MIIEIEEALARIVSRWVETKTPITADVSSGDTIISVNSTKRFQEGDEVLIQNPLEGEPNLVIEQIIDETTLQLATPVYNNWSVSENIMLQKLINGRFIEFIGIGDPEVIPMFPAITISTKDVSSEFMALRVYKERYEVELTIFVDDENYEDGRRFLLRMVDVVKEGLRQNFYPLVNDYDMTSITGDVLINDEVIRVSDSSIFNTPTTDTTGGYPRISDARIILEDRWKSDETRVQEILSPTEITIRPISCQNFNVSDNAVAIRPKRHLFNTWPHHTSLGKIAKQTLLQGAVIRWFAEEAVPFNFQNADPHLK